MDGEEMMEVAGGGGERFDQFVRSGSIRTMGSYTEHQLKRQGTSGVSGAQDGAPKPRDQNDSFGEDKAEDDEYAQMGAEPAPADNDGQPQDGQLAIENDGEFQQIDGPEPNPKNPMWCQVIQAMMFAFLAYRIKFVDGPDIYWKLLEEEKSLFYWIAANMVLYILDILTDNHLFGMPPCNFNCNEVRCFCGIPQFCFSLAFGLKMNGDKMNAFFNEDDMEKNAQLQEMQWTVQCMANFRLLPWYFTALICAFLVCILIIVLCVYAVKAVIDRGQAGQNMANLQNFFQRRSRNYDPKTDENETCTICLRNFADTCDQQIAQLECSSRHIFHVECLKQWVQNNDTCPICREQIFIE